MQVRPGIGLVLLALTAAGSARAADAVDYARQVKPLLRERCFACHGSLKQSAGLRLDSGDLIRRGGDGGGAVEPGHADESLLIDRVAETDPELRMPPEGEPLSAEQVGLLRAWIDQGAATPAGEQPEADPRDHWAFRKPTRPEPPNATGHPIDAFVDEQLRAKGLTPLPRAEPHVLIRRLYLDLTGLPPTRAELHEFLADPSDAAYERIADRLLDTPAHGERWARHWMDVWRYSDWYGRRAVPDVTNSYAMIWRWRDWIVRSIREDKGYDRMIVEMLAADEVAPDDDANLVATGYLVRNFYRWNYNSWMKDNVEHTARAFLGLTVQCAHCHDHKYDPIQHEDYFKFRAFFEPLEIRHDRVPGEPDPGPYPKYVYGSAHKPITSGLVRVFDEKLDAETRFYTRGEFRNVVEGKPPIPPGVPDFLGGRSFRVEPVDLPRAVAYPGLREFIRREETEKRRAALTQAEATLSKAVEQHAAAEQALFAVEAEHAGPAVPAFEGAATPAFAPAAHPLPEAYEPARAALRAAILTLAVDTANARAARAELASIEARIAADLVRHGGEAGDPKALALVASKAERTAAADLAAVELARAEREQSAARAKPEAERAKLAEKVKAARAAVEAKRKAAEPESEAYTGLSPVYPAKSTGRRTALANWIGSKDNPLTARVAVNHIWRWHFGQPLVASTADFGRNGKPPTHPGLIDWLAVELMEPSNPNDRPWSMKALHRRIVTSEAYKRSSKAGADHPSRSVDPDNVGYWRFPTNRMESEVVRDSLLHVAGELDPAIGGPDIDMAEGLKSRRRSLYFTHHGETRMTFLALFDAPDPIECYRRTTSVVPQQALALANNELALAVSRSLAAKLWTELEAMGDDSPGRRDAFIEAAFEQVLSRPPGAVERELTAGFLERQAGLFRSSGAAGIDPDARARENVVHALMNHNDFVTIR